MTSERAQRTETGIRIYRDLVLTTEWHEPGDESADRSLRFSVRVFSSPAGESLLVQRQLPPDLWERLSQLERGQLTVTDIAQLGRVLADLLLPPAIRALLDRSIDRLQPSQGLRLRLRLIPELATIPWEYMHTGSFSSSDGSSTGVNGVDDTTGFLALDPRLSIVRHEALPLVTDLDTTPKPRRLLVALVNTAHTALPPLDLNREKTIIESALRDVPGVIPDFVEDATMQRLSDQLLAGADIFHFAGHGLFDQNEYDRRSGTISGEGAIVLLSEDGELSLIPADQLAVNLRGRGVQLVVLGACETGQHGGHNVWGGVATAMMKAGIPAAVAMQFSIWDESALVFTRTFYQTLAAGYPLDQAMSSGRLAIFNLCHPRRHDIESSGVWRDWGVPVLYLRADQSFVLPAATDRQRVLHQVHIESSPPARPLQQPVSPHSYERILAEITEKLQQRRLTLFLGADLHEEEAGLPGRQALADALAAREGIAPGERLATVAQQVMRHGSRWEFTHFLMQVLEPPVLEPGPFHQAVARLIQLTRPDLVITTAYHRLLERALQQTGSIAFHTLIREEALRFVDAERLTILKLYGDIQQMDTLVVTEQDQNALLRGRDKVELVDEVRRVFRRTSLLFLGYDLRDPAVSALFDEVAGDRFQARSYAVWSGLDPRVMQSFEQNRGLMVLDMNSISMVHALIDRLI
jgi:hypothetical protein